MTRCFAFLTLLAIAAPSPTADVLPANEKLNTKITNVILADASGKPVALHGSGDKKAVVIVFLSFDCPVSIGYAPVLAELAKTYEARGVTIIGVNSSDDADAVQLAKLGAEYKLPFPVLKDHSRAAADAFKANTVPEVFVLDHNAVLRYRGRIDDSYSKRLVRAARVTRHDLKDALDDLLAGKEVRTPVTAAVGCPIPRENTHVTTGKSS